ncbi:MAG TPA: sulfurtransferase TusA family protein [Nitrospirae bacterium]|nr:sulfurtransferase TusA family protein [Nitrospirota bacterium]
MGELSSKEPTAVLDVLGRVCPYPLVLTKKKLEKMNDGEVLKVLCDASASAEDSIPQWAKKKGFQFESVKKEGEEAWDLYISRP